ncbi:MAG TPA: hypothetical protein VMT78_06945 [Terriglobia bacterium]|jgi:hypothetical protein|nr:hypothetical protein [Terriglobia bacterium]HVQ64258.1 hypothetical protein [Terriglobia bacterium]
MGRLLSIASIFFCFEIGLFLVIIPWSELWEGNYFLNYVPAFRPVVLHTFSRAGVTALGGIDILIGLSELRNFVRSLRAPTRTME